MAIKLLPDSLQWNVCFLWKLQQKKKLDKNYSKANCQIIEEAKQTLLRKQAQEILWPQTLVLSQEHGTSLQQWNKSQCKDKEGKRCLHCQRIASLSPSERCLQNGTRLSAEILQGSTRFLSPHGHPSWVTGNSMGHSLSRIPCYHCLFNVYLHLHILPLCLASVTDRTAYLCLLSTSLIRNVSMISPFAWSPPPLERES